MSLSPCPVPAMDRHAPMSPSAFLRPLLDLSTVLSAGRRPCGYLESEVPGAARVCRGIMDDTSMLPLLGAGPWTAARALTRAVESSGTSPRIDVVYAHGTGMVSNDIGETKA